MKNDRELGPGGNGKRKNLIESWPTINIEDPIEFIIRQEYEKQCHSAEETGYEDEKQDYDQFSARIKLKISSLSGKEIDDMLENAKNYYAESLSQASIEAIPFMGTQAQADFSAWSKCPVWTMEEAVALFLGRDPETFRWIDAEPWIPRSRRIRQAAMLRRQLEGSVALGRLKPKELPATVIDWASSHGLRFPRELQEFVYSELSFSIVHPKIDAFWEDLSGREKNSFFAIFTTMAIDGYRFDPEKTHSRVGSKISAAMAELKPASIGKKDALIADTITSIIKKAFEACENRASAGDYLARKDEREARAKNDPSKRRPSTTKKIGG